MPCCLQPPSIAHQGQWPPAPAGPCSSPPSCLQGATAVAGARALPPPPPLPPPRAGLRPRSPAAAAGRSRLPPAPAALPRPGPAPAARETPPGRRPPACPAAPWCCYRLQAASSLAGRRPCACCSGGRRWCDCCLRVCRWAGQPRSCNGGSRLSDGEAFRPPMEWLHRRCRRRAAAWRQRPKQEFIAGCPGQRAVQQNGIMHSTEA